MTRDRIGTLADAFAKVEDNSTIVTAMAASEPQLFYRNARDMLREKQNLRIYCANPSKNYEIFADESQTGRLELRPMFLTAAIRNHRNRKHVHYVPQHLSQWVAHVTRAPIGVFWGSCSVPDARGFVSLGPSVCYEYEILKKAKYVVLEVNPRIPFTFGSTFVHCSAVDVFVSSDAPLPGTPVAAPDATDRKIAAHISELVANGSTLQFGIGAIPNALAQALESKRDLGIHTEMINDAILTLSQSGAITGFKKTLWPDKIVGSFVFGSEALYHFVDDNPFVELHPASIINDPLRIGRNYRMISINSAIEVDITGQVCSESIGHLELTGVGGAADTHIGAQRSRHGRGIIALRSATKAGESKIVAELQPGAKVSVSRNDVDTVVTEFGIAELKGKTVAERALSLIQIAHPDQRDKLRAEGQKFGYL